MTFVNTGKISFTGLTDALEHPTNGLHKKLQDAGWTVHNSVVGTSGSMDIIYKSTGEDGTETKYIRVTQTGTYVVLFRTATYYTASGTPGANDGNEIGGANYTSIQLLAGGCNGWVIGDKDGIVWILEQGGYYSTYFFGSGARVERTAISGRTLMDEGAGKTIAGSGNTTFNVDSSANMLAGQKLFIIGYDTGTSKCNVLRCTLQSVDSPTQITVSNDSGTNTNFDDNALVGLDPMPMFLGRGNYHSAGGTKYMGEPAWGLYTIYNPATTRLTGTGQSYTTFTVALTTPAVYAYTYGTTAWAFVTSDPDANGQRPIFPCFAVGHYNYNGAALQAGSDQLRGRIDRICRTPFVSGSIAPEDTLTDNAGVTYLLIPDEFNRTNVDAGYNAIRTVA